MTDAYLDLNEDEQFKNEYETLLGIDEENIFKLIQKSLKKAENEQLYPEIPSIGERIEVIFGDQAAEEFEEISSKLKVSDETLCRAIVYIMEIGSDK